MNAPEQQNPVEPDFAAFVGIDWADQKHQFSLQEAGKCTKESGSLEQKPEVIGPWVARLRERFGGRPVAVAVEQSRGALVHALLSYDFLVLYPLHPQAVANFRQAFKPSGCKDDPLDTDQILEILTKHRDQLRPIKPDTEQTRLLGRLGEDRRKFVELRTAQIQALTASLKEYYPQALELVSHNLTSRLAYDLLMKWPTFQAFQKARPQAIRAFYYGHNVRSPQILEKALKLAKSAAVLTTDAALVESGSLLSRGYAQAIHTLNPIIADYEERMTQVFQAHPEAYLFKNLPGAGPVTGPRLCAFFGTDRSRYQKAENVERFCGIAPVTKKSGKTSIVFFRRACPKFDRQTFHEFARLSVAQCQWARNYVHYYLGRGKKFHSVIRALAFKWIRILFRCWQTRTPYNDALYMETLKKRGSIFATLHLQQKP